MEKKSPVIIKSNLEISPGAFILKFKRSFDFIPGQVIGVSISQTDEPRLYSIASGNTQEDVWILYTIKPDGQLTPELARLKRGDTILISEPFGKFTCSREPAYWIATGAGIAPFASMIFSGLSENKILIQGNRNIAGLYFYDQVDKKMGNRYKPCCSREETEGTFHGRVTEYIKSLQSIDAGIPYYLCGSAEMVVDVRDILIERGVPFHMVIAEIFF